MQTLKYFIVQTKYNLKNAMALSSSFWIGVLGMILNNFTFFIIWFLFMKATGPINGWTTYDVFGMLGVALICFGFTHSFFYGIIDLPESVIKGNFDSVLLSPVNSFIKLAGSSFSVTAYGDLIQGVVIVFMYGFLVHFSFIDWFLFLASMILGCVVFLCIRLLCSLVVFFIHDGEIISSQLFEIFLRPGLYPGAIFPNKLKIFFMTIIPTLFTSAVPVDVVKLSSQKLLFFGLLMTVFWVLVTCIVYHFAVKRYESGNLLR